MFLICGLTYAMCVELENNCHGATWFSMRQFFVLSKILTCREVVHHECSAVQLFP